MKTIEEISLLVDKYLPADGVGTRCEHDRMELHNAIYKLIADATRWKDPKEEMPEVGESVIVKYRTAKNVEKHGIGKYFDLGIGNPWIIEGSTSRNVIGWRPIECLKQSI